MSYDLVLHFSHCIAGADTGIFQRGWADIQLKVYF